MFSFTQIIKPTLLTLGSSAVIFFYLKSLIKENSSRRQIYQFLNYNYADKYKSMIGKISKHIEKIIKKPFSFTSFIFSIFIAIAYINFGIFIFWLIKGDFYIAGKSYFSVPMIIEYRIGILLAIFFIISSLLLIYRKITIAISKSIEKSSYFNFIKIVYGIIGYLVSSQTLLFFGFSKIFAYSIPSIIFLQPMYAPLLLAISIAVVNLNIGEYFNSIAFSILYIFILLMTGFSVYASTWDTLTNRDPYRVKGCLRETIRVVIVTPILFIVLSSLFTYVTFREFPNYRTALFLLIIFPIVNGFFDYLSFGFSRKLISKTNSTLFKQIYFIVFDFLYKIILCSIQLSIIAGLIGWISGTFKDPNFNINTVLSSIQFEFSDSNSFLFVLSAISVFAPFIVHLLIFFLHLLLRIVFIPKICKKVSSFIYTTKHGLIQFGEEISSINALLLYVFIIINILLVFIPSYYLIMISVPYVNDLLSFLFMQFQTFAFYVHSLTE